MPLSEIERQRVYDRAIRQLTDDDRPARVRTHGVTVTFTSEEELYARLSELDLLKRAS